MDDEIRDMTRRFDKLELFRLLGLIGEVARAQREQLGDSAYQQIEAALTQAIEIIRELPPARSHLS